MAALESYSPCPCGSGQKYKWCCQKAEAFAHKSARLQDSGAFEPAKAALDEGLAKFPDTPWLMLRKAVLLAKLQKLAEAGIVLHQLLKKMPEHVGGQSFLVRVLLETEGAKPAVAQLQSALNSVSEEMRSGLAATIQIVGIILVEDAHVPAALAHFELASRLALEDAELPYPQSHRSLEGNIAVSPWLRNQYQFTKSAVSLQPEQAQDFANAVKWAEQGLWSSAASAFDLLSAAGVNEATRNAGLCRLYLADDLGAVESLRRYIATQGNSVDAVDLEAVCQMLSPPKPSDLVAHVQLIWNLRDRAGLINKLKADSSVATDGPGPLDPADPNSPEVEWFLLLDRAMPTATEGISAKDLPRIEARVLVGTDIAALDLIDDGRLDQVRDRLTDLAGSSLPPAHPRTKTLGPVSRMKLALNTEILMPEGLGRNDQNRIRAEEHAHIVSEVWPETPVPYLGGRTPRTAAADGNAEVPLRAALVQFEFLDHFWTNHDYLTTLRASLDISPEPAIDPETVDLETLHIGRLGRVPVAALTDVNLLVLFVQSRRYVLQSSLEGAARELIQRPSIFERGLIDSIIPYADLANLELSRGTSKEQIFEVVTQGRDLDRNPVNAVRWDFLDLRLRVRLEKPEEWVPKLAILLERYAEDRNSSSTVMLNLYEMGLVEMSPSPDEPGQMLLDTRRLQTVLAEFGPKITTASGRLGVSATQNNVWTPGSAGGSSGGGGIWTPGSSKQPAAGSDKPKLILPGR